MEASGELGVSPGRPSWEGRLPLAPLGPLHCQELLAVPSKRWSGLRFLARPAISTKEKDLTAARGAGPPGWSRGHRLPRDWLFPTAE